MSIVQNPTTSLAADLAATKQVLDQQDGPTILVGHSYGGVVITEAGNHPNVAALVYIAAFAPDEGESVASLIAKPAAGRVGPADPAAGRRLPLPRLREVRGVVRCGPRSHHRAVSRRLAGPWGVQALEGAVTRPAWRTKPSWYLIATDDRMIFDGSNFFDADPAPTAMFVQVKGTIAATRRRAVVLSHWRHAATMAMPFFTRAGCIILRRQKATRTRACVLAWFERSRREGTNV